MSVIADFPDFSPHVAHADQIAATGVPLLTKNTRVIQQADPAVGPGVTHSTGNLAMTQIGYEVLLTAQFTGSPVTPFVEVMMTWIDSTTSQTIMTDTFFAPGGSAGTKITMHARGPTKADTVNVSYTNLDSVSAVTIGLTVLNNSRVYPYDMLRWINSAVRGVTVAGFNLATLPDDESVLGILNAQTIAASGNSQWLIAPGHGGWVNLTWATATVTPSNLTITVYGRPTSVYTGTGYAFRFNPAGPSGTATFKAPRSAMLFEVNNSSAVVGTISMMALVSP